MTTATETAATFYVRDESSGDRADFSTKDIAMAFGRVLAKRTPRCMVCKASGRIVAAWDNGKRSI